MSRSLLTFLVFAAFAAGAFAYPRLVWPPVEAAAAEPEPARQRARGPARRRPQRRAAAARIDYSNFSHSTAAHRQRSCQSCHTIPTSNWSRVRARDEAFPDVADYPGHDSCLDCHRRQFFSGARPVICSVCHTNPSPRDAARFPFRNPEERWAAAPKKGAGESEFVTRFPHDRHQDVMAGLDPGAPLRGFGFARASFVARQGGAAAEPLNSCTVCHKVHEPQGKSDEQYVKAPPEAPKKDGLDREEPFWFKKGTMMTTPGGHASCFSCHWQEGGVEPLSSRCDQCHTLLTAGLKLQLDLEGADAEPSHPSVGGVLGERMLAQWKQRRVARFNHEHDRHRIACTSCHVAVTAASRVNSDTLYVPIQTCGRCHGAKTGNNSRAILAKEVAGKKKDESFKCTKCHVNLGDVPAAEIPRSHTAMIE
ncbi:MAG TPA: cytochrome c3 family protein [Pyrinomonadaceae bacterium]|nr:cytochrome c3 family protein [Pyrinomonadaceae bacterium]